MTSKDAGAIDAAAVRRLIDKSQIQDAMCRYARGVDRRDWELVRSVFHDDAQDEHGEYRGSRDGFLRWVAERHARIDVAVHFLGNCLIEFDSDDAARVETYFITMRPGESLKEIEARGGEDRTSLHFGRYVDRFERRKGAWKIAARKVVFDAKFALAAQHQLRSAVFDWGARDASDPVFQGAGGR